MSAAYRYLEDNGIPVLSANICYSETSEDHETGENVFTPYITKTINVAGHDHNGGYSNTRETNKAGKEVLVVNGGSQDLTESVIRFKEDADGKLTYEVIDSQNLKLEEYEPDAALEDAIRPYAKMAEDEVNLPIG